MSPCWEKSFLYHFMQLFELYLLSLELQNADVTSCRLKEFEECVGCVCVCVCAFPVEAFGG